MLSAPRMDLLLTNVHAMWYADYVAAGCIGPEPREWPDSADPWITEAAHAPPVVPA